MAKKTVRELRQYIIDHGEYIVALNMAMASGSELPLPPEQNFPGSGQTAPPDGKAAVALLSLIKVDLSLVDDYVKSPWLDSKLGPLEQAKAAQQAYWDGKMSSVACKAHLDCIIDVASLEERQQFLSFIADHEVK